MNIRTFAKSHCTNMEELLEKDEQACDSVNLFFKYFEFRELMRVFYQNESLFEMVDNSTGCTIDTRRMKILTLTGSSSEG